MSRKNLYYIQLHKQLAEKYDLYPKTIEIIRSGLINRKKSKKQIIHDSEVKIEHQMAELTKMMNWLKANEQAIDVMKTWTDDSIAQLLVGEYKPD